eukprot:360029-Chlamydomonas_euryale.AAC.5
MDPHARSPTPPHPPRPQVRVKLARSSDEIPGVAGRPAPPPSFTEHEVSMRREHIDVSPLYATALPLPPPRRQPDAPVRYAGYLRLSQFSNNAAAEMEAAIQVGQGALSGGVCAQHACLVAALCASGSEAEVRLK